MRARRLIVAVVLTAAAFSSTVAGLAITGTFDKAFASSPVSSPVSQPQNPGQNGQNPGQSGKGQNTTTTTTTTTTTPPPPFSTTVVGPASGATLDPAQGYELAAVATPGATGVTFEGTDLYGVYSIGSATQDLSGTWVLDVPAITPDCNNEFGMCFPGRIGVSIQSVATYAGGVSVTSPDVDVNLVVYCLSPVGCPEETP